MKRQDGVQKKGVHGGARTDILGKKKRATAIRLQIHRYHCQQSKYNRM